MKSKRIFAVCSIAIILGVLGLTYYLLNKDIKEENKPAQTDAEKFALEYTKLSDDNVFVYATADEIIKVMENGTGVVYLGFPECPWCQAYVVYLNEVAQELGFEKIYYYNILEDRNNNTEVYQQMVALLSDKLEYDEDGNHRIYVPNVSFHVKGELIGNDFETAYDTKGFEDPADYWTAEEVKDLKTRLMTYMEIVDVDLNSCTECNE